jgi:threonine aldolase
MRVPSNNDTWIVDLRSDTVTQPTPEMREAMARAEVGDDVLGEDPTVNDLQERAAKLLEKEAGLFVPSGTMANLLATLSQTRPGDAILIHRDAHPFNSESANLGMIAGALPRPLGGNQGILDPEEVERQVDSGDDHHHAPTTLVAVENTTNAGGGAIYPIETLAAIRSIADKHGLRVHCDGARLFNATVASGLDPADFARHAHTVSFCFSKGLGAPVGSMLVGDTETINRAHRFRKMLGGGMRQVGVIAAAARYALDHHVTRLAEDHARAARFRQALEDEFTFPMPTPTNIVFVDLPDARAFVERLAHLGVLALATGPCRIRLLFHLDINDEAVDRAIEAFKKAAQ